MKAETTPTALPDSREATRVEAVSGAPGRYRAHLSKEWDAPIHPSGGLVCAIALRAMQDELGLEHQRLRAFSTLFVSPVASGPLDVRVERLREGKRMSHLRAEVRSAGSDEVGHVTTAAFGESRPAVGFTYAPAPETGPPGDYPGPADPPPGVPVFRARFFENLETRRVRIHHSFETGWQGGRAEAIRWLRYRVPPRLPDGRLDPLLLAAVADTMPPSVGQFLGPGAPFFHAPSVDLNMHLFADTRSEWLLVRSLCRWAGDGYASAENTLWDEDRRLVAYATQIMLLRFPDPSELGLA